MPGIGLPGRLTKGAGTHLASWLQHSEALTPSEGQELLDLSITSNPNEINKENNNVNQGAKKIEALFAKHGRKAGHANPITDVAYSGDIIITKDMSGMRLWRASGDYALLRCVSARGPHVAIHCSGQFLVTGKRGNCMKGVKVWGPAGGSAFSAGKKDITTGGKGVKY